MLLWNLICLNPYLFYSLFISFDQNSSVGNQNWKSSSDNYLILKNIYLQSTKVNSTLLKKHKKSGNYLIAVWHFRPKITLLYVILLFLDSVSSLRFAEIS